MPTVAELLPRLCEDAPAATHAQTHTVAAGVGMAGSIRRLAMLQDGASFAKDALPPALLHASCECKANWLYGRMQPSTHPDTEYQIGAFARAARAERTIQGAAMLDVNGRAHPVLVYTASIDGVATLVCHAHAAPLAELEAALLAEVAAPSAIEVAAVPRGMAEQLVELRARVGEYARGGGLATLPGFLLDGNYHLVRHGPVGALHLRSPTSDHELERLEKLCLAACLADNAAAPDARPATQTDGPIVSEAICAVFDRRPEPMAFAVDANADLQPADVLVEGMAALQPVANSLARRPVVVRLAQAVLAHETRGAFRVPDAAIEACEREVFAAELDDASAMERASPDRITLSALLHMASLGVRVVDVGPATVHECHMLRLANAVCDAGNSALAVRDLDGWVRTGPDDATAKCGFSSLCAFARRIAEPGAVLALDVEQTSNYVAQMRLINSTVDRGVGADEAARLIGFPWVVPIARVHHPPGTAAGGPTFVLVERTDAACAARGLLCVTDAVRTAYGAAPSKPRPTVGPEDLDRFKRELLGRMTTIEQTLREQPAPVAPAPVAPVAPVQEEEAAQAEPPSRAVMRATLAMLDRVARKRNVSALAEA